MPVYNGVEYWEDAPASPEFSFLRRGESRLTGSYQYNWADLLTPDGTAAPPAQAAFLGWSELGDMGGGPFLEGSKYYKRHLPFLHPDFPDQRYACDGFSKVIGDVPSGAPSVSARGTADFDRGKATVGFVSPRRGLRYLADSVMADLDGIPREYYLLRYCEVSEKAIGKTQTIPGTSGLIWGSDNQPAILHAFMQLYEAEITVVLKEVPLTCWPAEATIASLIGKCNIGPFPPTPTAAAGGLTSVMTQRPAETLVFGVPQKEPVLMPKGGWSYDVTFTFRYYPNGANHFFRHNKPGGAGWDLLKRPDASVMFPSVSFQLAFLPP